jgi:hypothetical protein
METNLMLHAIVGALVRTFGGLFFTAGYYGFAALTRQLRRIFRR